MLTLLFLSAVLTRDFDRGPTVVPCAVCRKDIDATDRRYCPKGAVCWECKERADALEETWRLFEEWLRIEEAAVW